LRANSSAARLGEQCDPALGHRIKQIDRRSDETLHGSQVDYGAALHHCAVRSSRTLALTTSCRGRRWSNSPTEPVSIGKRADCQTTHFREIATMAWYRRARFDRIGTGDEWPRAEERPPQTIESITWPEILGLVLDEWAIINKEPQNCWLFLAVFWPRPRAKNEGFRGRLVLWLLFRCI
jgi:hypothetical protein